MSRLAEDLAQATVHVVALLVFTAECSGKGVCM